MRCDGKNGKKRGSRRVRTSGSRKIHIQKSAPLAAVTDGNQSLRAGGPFGHRRDVQQRRRGVRAVIYGVVRATVRCAADVDEQVVAPACSSAARGEPAAAAWPAAPVRPGLVHAVPERRGVAARARQPFRLAAVLRERAHGRREARRARPLALAVGRAVERVERARARGRRERRRQRGLVSCGGDTMRSIPPVGVVRDMLQAVGSW